MLWNYGAVEVVIDNISDKKLVSCTGAKDVNQLVAKSGKAKKLYVVSVRQIQMK